jgi:hypothetical protein
MQLISVLWASLFVPWVPTVLAQFSCVKKAVWLFADDTWSVFLTRQQRDAAGRGRQKRLVEESPAEPFVSLVFFFPFLSFFFLSYLEAYLVATSECNN